MKSSERTDIILIGIGRLLERRDLRKESDPYVKIRISSVSMFPESDPYAEYEIRWETGNSLLIRCIYADKLGGDEDLTRIFLNSYYSSACRDTAKMIQSIIETHHKIKMEVLQ